VTVATHAAAPAAPEAPTARRQRPLYRLWPKQLEALALFGFGPLDDPSVRAARPVEEMLYGGEAGGGKSLLARALAVTLMTLWDDAVIGLFRRTYPELEDSHIRPIQKETAGTLFTWHEGRRELRAPNRAVTLFRYCDNVDDLRHYQSAEFDALLIDESTHFPADWIEFLRARVRSTRPGWRPIILYTTNPGGVSHAYHKAQFIDPHPPGTVWEAAREDGGLRRVFHRARLDDNPALGEEYRRRLEGIKDEVLRRQLLTGDWNTLGQQFFPEFKEETHTVPAFPIPPHWRERAIGVDFGYGAPWSCHFYARDEDLWKEQKLSRWFVYRERYEKHVRDADQATWIAEMIRRDREATGRRATRPPRFTLFCDPAIWSKQPNGLSVADVYTRVLADVGVTPLAANNDRLSGWSRVRDYLALTTDGYPGVVYLDTCPQAIATIPALQRSHRDPEDADTRGDDHACDELRYVLMGLGAPQQAIDNQYAPTQGDATAFKLATSATVGPGGQPLRDAAGTYGRTDALIQGPARVQYPGGSQPALLSPQQQANFARWNAVMGAARGHLPRAGLGGRLPSVKRSRT
jgi:phage terminase large subunit